MAHLGDIIATHNTEKDGSGLFYVLDENGFVVAWEDQDAIRIGVIRDRSAARPDLPWAAYTMDGKLAARCASYQVAVSLLWNRAVRGLAKKWTKRRNN